MNKIRSKQHLFWEKLNSLFIYMMLFGFPIIMLIPIALRTNTTPYSIAFRGFCVLLMLYLFFSPIRNDKENKKVFSSFLLLLMFWIILLIRIIFDFEFTNVLRQDNLVLNPIQVYLFAIFLSLIPIIVIYKNRYLISIEKVENSIFKIAIVSALSVLVGLIMNYGTNFSKIFLERTELSYGAETGVHPLNPISISRAGSIVILLTINQFFLNKSLNRLYLLLSLCLGFSLLLLGGSRGPFISTFIILFILFVTYRNKYSAKRLLFYSLIVFVILFHLINIEELSIVKRFDNPIYGKDPTRAEIWDAAFDYFMKSPVWGYSIVDKFGIYPHNIYLETLMAVGLLGTLPFIFIITRIIKIFIKEFKKGSLTNLMTITLAYLLFASSSGSLYYTPELWVLIPILLFRNLTRNLISLKDQTS
ncbi:O-antigen ligase family protein [Ignavibacterium sp.]|uniref:O-antigen ligase family protein n=1 Tax=Ignavibacterium sp. TaxID=2651167 RepID=UPI00260FD121|nr:O-antigen ligase family protein [Ignavibacterium sp.]